jgi:hypothetical protein
LEAVTAAALFGVAAVGRSELVVVGLSSAMKLHPRSSSLARSNVGSTQKAAIQFAMFNVA